MNNRRNFIRQSFYAGTGLVLPSYLLWGCGNSGANSPNTIISSQSPTIHPQIQQANLFGGVSKVVGYLIPVLIEQGVKKLFDSFGTDSSSDHPSSVVDQSINIFSNGQYEVSASYKNHYNKIVSSKLGTERLNGVGFLGEDTTIKSTMNDMNARATSPIHSVKDLNTFNVNSWNSYCDLSDLQTDDSGRVYVTPRDDRQAQWKDTFFVTQELAYLLYNPLYYCHGLPIENPQIYQIDDRFKRDVYQRTGLTTSKNSYSTQKFYFHGTNCKDLKSKEPETIYFGVDDALHAYFNLSTLKPCGDCKGDGIGRPNMDRH